MAPSCVGPLQAATAAGAWLPWLFYAQRTAFQRPSPCLPTLHFATPLPQWSLSLRDSHVWYKRSLRGWTFSCLLFSVPWAWLSWIAQSSSSYWWFWLTLALRAKRRPQCFRGGAKGDERQIGEVGGTVIRTYFMCMKVSTNSIMVPWCDRNQKFIFSSMLQSIH